LSVISCPLSVVSYQASDFRDVGVQVIFSLFFVPYSLLDLGVTGYQINDILDAGVLVIFCSLLFIPCSI
jgi:hypothetical protein